MCTPNTAKHLSVPRFGCGSLAEDQPRRRAAQLEADLATRGDSARATIDRSDRGWELFGGGRVNRWRAAELGYVDLGKLTSTIDATVRDTAAFVGDVVRVHPCSVSGGSLSGVGLLPFEQHAAAFAKAGVFRRDADIEAGPVPAGAPRADIGALGRSGRVGTLPHRPQRRRPVAAQSAAAVLIDGGSPPGRARPRAGRGVPVPVAIGRATRTGRCGIAARCRRHGVMQTQVHAITEGPPGACCDGSTRRCPRRAKRKPGGGRSKQKEHRCSIDVCGK